MDDIQDDSSTVPDMSAEEVRTSAMRECEHCAEYLAGWKRAQADYQNLKKEVERERVEFAKYANERLLRELIPAMDQFSLALRYLPDTGDLPEEQKKTWKNWLTGICAVGTLWDQLASSMGLERIPIDCAFDPAWHEAAGEEDQAEKEPGSIIRVLADGWRLHGKVIRPARVILAKQK